MQKFGIMLWTMTLLTGAGAQTPIPHTPEPLWPGAPPLAQGTADIDIPTLTAYLPAQNPTGTAVIIAPGGSYAHLSMQKEGEDAALWLNAHGVAGFVLKYRLGPKYHHPVELGDAQRALRTVRANASRYGLAANHIGIWGFSAGGHLAASAGTIYDSGLATGDAIDHQSSRPDFMVLAYPVITLEQQYGHSGSRENLLGKTPNPALVLALSPEKHITADTPQAFIFASSNDRTVNVMNSVLMYSAFAAAKVPAELHIFVRGDHGSGIGAGNPDVRIWPDLLAIWMRSRGFMGPA